jgi:hypothetical protein
MTPFAHRRKKCSGEYTSHCAPFNCPDGMGPGRVISRIVAKNRSAPARRIRSRGTSSRYNYTYLEKEAAVLELCPY